MKSFLLFLFLLELCSSVVGLESLNWLPGVVQTPLQGLKHLVGFDASWPWPWEKHHYIPPKEGDLRSPCPGLNALANHGFIPRDGKGMTIPIVLDACLDAFNILPDPQIIMVAKMALFTTDARDSFTLKDLALHGTIEHDASISRSDTSLGDSLSFNQTLFNLFLSQSNPGKDVYDPVSAGHVQHDRLQDSIERNPNVTNTIKEFMQRSLESALYLGAMGDPMTGIAPKNSLPSLVSVDARWTPTFVDVLFQEERIPYAEGWERSSIPINSTMFNNIATQIGANSNWAPSGGCPWLRLQPEGPEKLPGL
ncbi:Cloroperoxidase [Dendrothele bispora CBS 962.96]|uniref:Cloroperoxidase n=1 Tax=Dendrothele bispora (strain CBS 962.96) TaxID=1314807 RepID=A0A4S8KXW3_DENBC|nr:Cloroperoxidase [Dendrothele bispora CBS 962.96]